MHKENIDTRKKIICIIQGWFICPFTGIHLCSYLSLGIKFILWLHKWQCAQAVPLVNKILSSLSVINNWIDVPFWIWESVSLPRRPFLVCHDPIKLLRNDTPLHFKFEIMQYLLIWLWWLSFSYFNFWLIKYILTCQDHLIF